MRTVVLSMLSFAVVAAGGNERFGRGPFPDSCGEREVVEVSDVASLVANIERDQVEIVMAPGRYALSACPPGVSEWSASACGQLEQGQCSVLRSSLDLPITAHRVPVGPGPEVPSCDAIPAATTADGAVIDCSALPASAQELSCVVAGRLSAIADVTICNSTPPVALAPGQLGTHRNAIAIAAGKEALIERVRMVNARRGVLLASESDQLSRGEVRQSLGEGTELAGVAFATRPLDDAAVPFPGGAAGRL